MELRVDPSSDRPAFEQLHAQVARAVERGRLRPGDRLPPVRDLAERVGIAPNTAAKAYRALERDGYVEGRGRHGTFVAARRAGSGSPDARLAKAAERFAERAAELGASDAAAVRAVRAALARERSSRRR